MANHKSSEKRARSTEKKRQRNSNYLSSVRTAVKKYRFALNGLAAGTGEEAAKVMELLTKAQSALAKACLLYPSPSPRDRTRSRMPSSA